MTFTDLLADYGYWAVLAGSLLEGESILLLAGIAAHEGHLSLPIVIGIAFVGGIVGDQIFFRIGRSWGEPVLARMPRAEPRVARVQALLRRHDALLIIGIRFMYGLRIVGPIAIGASEVSPWRFFRFNVIGAAIWAPLVAGCGYLFGSALGTVVNRLGHAEQAGLVGVLLLLALVVVVRKRRARLREPAPAEKSGSERPSPVLPRR